MSRLILFSEHAVADAALFLGRVAKFDPAAVVRVRSHADDVVALWAWLPVGVLAVRGLPGTVDEDSVVPAEWLLDRLAEEVELTERRDTAWRGALPAGGFQRLDTVPSEVLARLAVAGERTFAEAVAGVSSVSGSRSVGEALLDHVALVVSDASDSVDVPQRVVQALAALRFVGGATAGGSPTAGGAPTAGSPTAGVPPAGGATLEDEAVAVDVTPAWLRLSSARGAVYARRGPTLGLTPR